MVGCPAVGNSVPGVKMRTLKWQEESSGGKTKVVSERFSSLAMDWYKSGGTCAPSGNTASGLPPKGWVVNTSTR